ncbi:hypothetical protein AMTRI_Chr02g257370 [Amborella trichopoda]
MFSVFFPVPLYAQAFVNSGLILILVHFGLLLWIALALESSVFIPFGVRFTVENYVGFCAFDFICFGFRLSYLFNYFLYIFVLLGFWVLNVQILSFFYEALGTTTLYISPPQ